jgi:hypothetical protein
MNKPRLRSRLRCVKTGGAGEITVEAGIGIEPIFTDLQSGA